jgi:hemerythrin-like domain-containing protein
MSATSRTTVTPRRVRPREDGDPVPDVQGLQRAHRSMLRDADRLTDLAEHLAAATRPVGHRRAAAVSRFVHAWAESVLAAHRTQEQVLWPVLITSVGPHLDLSELAGDHAALVHGLARVHAASGAFAARPEEDRATLLAVELADVRDALREHVGEEEAVVLPALQRYVSVPDWQRIEPRLAGRARRGAVLLGPVVRRRERQVFGR